MNIFITGANGFIGKNFIKKLQENKIFFVYALGRKSKKRHPKVQ